MHKDQYYTLLSFDEAPPSGEMRDLINRRTAPLFDKTGMSRSMDTLLA